MLHSATPFVDLSGGRGGVVSPLELLVADMTSSRHSSLLTMGELLRIKSLLRIKLLTIATVPECVRPVSPVTMLPVLSSVRYPLQVLIVTTAANACIQPPLSVVPVTTVS